MHDGDTINALIGVSNIKVRINGVDSPEMGQPYSNAAKQFTSNLVFGRTVLGVIYGEDKYGRYLGDVYLPGMGLLSQQLVKNGYAWWYEKYAPNDTVLKASENQAKIRRIGLWHDLYPVEPWIFREAK